MNSDGLVNLPAPYHLGIVVKDVNESSQFYSSLFPLGKWEIFDYETNKEDMLMGEPFGLVVGMAQWGPVIMELLQPVKGESVWSQFLSRHGEGLHHTCHLVRDFDVVVEGMKAHRNELAGI
ncbi:MAG: VOC family protein, partial [Candidatus Marsarchaeota archaeon]|nr:VOC family protein [Candidatus Marsarchaeota archaeon]